MCVHTFYLHIQKKGRNEKEEGGKEGERQMETDRKRETPTLTQLKDTREGSTCEVEVASNT